MQHSVGYSISKMGYPMYFWELNTICESFRFRPSAAICRLRSFYLHAMLMYPTEPEYLLWFGLFQFILRMIDNEKKAKNVYLISSKPTK